VLSSHCVALRLGRASLCSLVDGEYQYCYLAKGDCLPRIRVVFYQESPDNVPVLDWLRTLETRDRLAYAKCVARIKRLAQAGHELRRPEADYLRDGMHELRVHRGRVNYRILYFFHHQTVAVLSHALTKEDRVPAAEIDRAVRRKLVYEQAPEGHTYEAALTDGQESP
jgi:hypothetical protein